MHQALKFYLIKQKNPKEVMTFVQKTNFKRKLI